MIDRDLLKLDNNIVGCLLSGLEVRRSSETLNVLRSNRGRGSSLMKNPILGRNGRPLLPGFQCLYSLNQLTNSTIISRIDITN